MKILVTGAAGFIGSSFVRKALAQKHEVYIFDSLTYAGHFGNVSDLVDEKTCFFFQGDLRDSAAVRGYVSKTNFDSIVHFAAESHVDNSISGPQAFVETNIVGTFNLLEAAREICKKRSEPEQKKFRFVHVSTDEVFGQLGAEGKFSETTPYSPNSPYSATKAASDHLVRAWFHTYGLPTIITNCSNNYGPRQFPEKLIPRMILCALEGKNLPVYGKGENIRDWIHVDDHSAGVLLALTKGQPGESYCFGGNSERKNIDVVKSVCKALDELKPRADKQSYEKQISFVEDRLGHDFRYAIDDSFAQKTLGFKREHSHFEQGLKQTIQWYLSNPDWVQEIVQKAEKK